MPGPQVIRHATRSLAIAGSLSLGLVVGCASPAPVPVTGAGQPALPATGPANPGPAAAVGGLTTFTGSATHLGQPLAHLGVGVFDALTNKPIGLLTTDGQAVIAGGAANVVAPGGANVIAPGGANVVAAGGANVIAPGGANVIAPGGANVIAPGGANVVAAGGLNYRVAQAASGLTGELSVASGGLTTDAEGRFQLTVTGLAPGRAVRLVVMDGTRRVETTLTARQAADAASGLRVDEAATARSLLERGLYASAGALVGADTRLGAAEAPLGAIERAHAALVGLEPTWADRLRGDAALAGALGSFDVAAARARSLEKLSAMIDRLALEVAPALDAVVGPASDATLVRRERATWRQAIAQSRADLGFVLLKLEGLADAAAWRTSLARLDALPSAPLLQAFHDVAATLPESDRTTELRTHLAAAWLKAGRAEFTALGAVGDADARRALVKRLLAGDGAACLAPDAARRLNLTAPALQALVRETIASLDAARALPLWRLVAADARLAELAGGITPAGMGEACQSPATLRAIHNRLFDAIAALGADERQDALGRLVAASAPTEAFQAQLALRLDRADEAETKALLAAFAPATPAQLATTLEAAYGLGAPADRFPDRHLSPVLADMAEALAFGLADEFQAAQARALAEALGTGDGANRVFTTIADAVSGLIGELASAHAQLARPLSAPIAFPGTPIALQRDAASALSTALRLVNTLTGQAIGLVPGADVHPLFGGAPRASGSGGSGGGAPPTGAVPLPPVSGTVQ